MGLYTRVGPECEKLTPEQRANRTVICAQLKFRELERVRRETSIRNMKMVENFLSSPETN